MVGYGGNNLPGNGVYWGYNPLSNPLLTSWDIQVVVFFSASFWGVSYFLTRDSFSGTTHFFGGSNHESIW